MLTELEPWECAIVAAVLAPTDAALGQAVVSSPAVPARVRQALNVESGLNDGGSVPFLMLFIAVGALGGLALLRAAERGWSTTIYERLGLAAVAIIAFVAADEVGGSRCWPASRRSSW